MVEVLKVKDWIQNKHQQFRIILKSTNDTILAVERLVDKKGFSAGDNVWCSKVADGYIIGFEKDMRTVWVSRGNGFSISVDINLIERLRNGNKKS